MRKQELGHPTSPPPQWMLEQGCQVLAEGQIFRLLGIPMGFNVSIKQKWDWVMTRTAQKFDRWAKTMLSMAGKILVINHFIIPSIIYFLACWRPPETALKKFSSLCRNFLWGGGTDYRLPKVSWDVCTLHKDRGGLGILNISEMANRLASKWIVRSLLWPDEDWAVLLHRNLPSARLKDLPRWREPTLLTLFFSQWPVKPKGSPLVKSLWGAWNEIKGLVTLRENKQAISFLAQDSLWLPISGHEQVAEEDKDTARRLHNKGIRKWMDIWSLSHHSWAPAEELIQKFRLTNRDMDLLNRRASIVEPQELWKLSIREELSAKGVGWTARTPLYPIPKMEQAPPIHIKLNQKWQILLDRKQWYFKFTKLWLPSIQPKQSVHMWLILHKGLWTGERALKLGIGNGLCPRCKRDVESLQHLFLTCPHNHLILSFLNNVLKAFGKPNVTWKQLLLGDYIGCSAGLWNTIRGCILWFVWLQRNAALFGSPPPALNSLFTALMSQVRQRLQLTIQETQNRLEYLKLGKEFIRDEVVWTSNHHTIYHTWNSEQSDLATSVGRDQQLSALLVDVGMFYRHLDELSP